MWGEEFLDQKLPVGLFALNITGVSLCYRASSLSSLSCLAVGFDPNDEPISVSVGLSHAVILTNTGKVCPSRFKAVDPERLKVFTFGHWEFLGIASATSINPVENPGAFF